MYLSMSLTDLYGLAQQKNGFLFISQTIVFFLEAETEKQTYMLVKKKV